MRLFVLINWFCQEPISIMSIDCFRHGADANVALLLVLMYSSNTFAVDSVQHKSPVSHHQCLSSVLYEEHVSVAHFPVESLLKYIWALRPWDFTKTAHILRAASVAFVPILNSCNEQNDLLAEPLLRYKWAEYNSLLL